MNLKLLEKLVRLANNNPNENEANLAARRACKLIQEGEFKFSEDKQARTASDKFAGFSPPHRQEDFFYGAWSYETKRNPFEGQAHRYNPEYKGEWKGPPRREAPKCSKCGKQLPIFYMMYSGELYCTSCDPNRMRSPHSQAKEVRTLTCTECKQPKETKFVGRPEVFICSDCQWTSFEEKRK